MRLSAKQVQDGFGVSAVTVYNWRKGLNGRTKLPVHAKPRGEKMSSVYFELEEVLKWADKNNVVFDTDRL